MKLILLATILLSVLLPCVAAVPGPATSECDNYRHESVVAIALQVQAGDNEAWGGISGRCGIARSNTQVLLWTGEYSGPVFLAPATVTWVVGDAFTGCTLSAFTIVSNTILGNAGSIASARVTMTSNECRGSIVFTISIPLVYTWSAIFPVNLQVEQTTFNSVQSGTVNNVLSGTVNSVLSGTIAVVNSGTEHLIIDSWPNLVAAVTNSGTINVVNSGGQTMTLSGSVALSGGITVTNAGGQSITITSWPQLQAVLSGEIHLCGQEAAPACGVVHTDANTTIMGNVSTNQTNLPAQRQPFQGTLFILLLTIGLIVAIMGIVSENYTLGIIGGVFILVDAFVLMNTPDQVFGFTGTNHKAKIGVEFLLFGLGAYLILESRIVKFLENRRKTNMEREN